MMDTHPELPEYRPMPYGSDTEHDNCRDDDRHPVESLHKKKIKNWNLIWEVEFRIVDEPDEIIPWILQCRHHDLTSDIHRLLDFGCSTFSKISIGRFYIFDSPEYGNIFSLWSLLRLKSELISTDMVSDIEGFIEIRSCLKSSIVPCFRFSEIAHFVYGCTKSEDRGSHNEK